MIKFIFRLIGTIIIYLVSNYGTFYITSYFFHYNPNGLMYTLFYILIGLIALTFEKIIYSESKSHFIQLILIVALSIIFYYK